MVAPPPVTPIPTPQFHSCEQPTFDWVALDHGHGTSRAYEIVALGNSIYFGGVSSENTTIEGPIPTTRNTRQVAYTSGGFVDQAVVRLSTGGTPMQVHHVDGSRECCSRFDSMRSIAPFHDGSDRNLAVGGYFRGTLTFPGAGAATAASMTNDKTNSRAYDGFVAKLDGWSGEFAWATHLATGSGGIGDVGSAVNATLTGSRDSCSIFSGYMRL